MNPQQLKRLSRTLAYALRHNPAEFGLAPDADGWVAIDDLLAALHRHPRWQYVSRADLHAVIDTAEKPRYQIDGDNIRARHGHSLTQKVTYPTVTPPNVLYHGTTDRALPLILESGLKPMRRQYVHYAMEVAMALDVGDRHQGTPVLLKVDARAAHQDGIAFYNPSAAIWLSDALPPRYLMIVENPSSE